MKVLISRESINILLDDEWVTKKNTEEKMENLRIE